MDSKLLTESGWKTTVQKFKVKDNGLQRALSLYEKLPADKYADRLKALAAVTQLATALKKAKEVALSRDVLKYLTDMLSVAQTEQRDITQANSAAEKAEVVAAKAEAMTQKKAEAEAKKRYQDEGADEDQEEEEGDYHVKLMAAFQKLKGAKDLSYQFIVCDAKPHCAVMIAKRITAKHKEELTKVTGGSKRFLKLGICRVDNGKLTFEMEEPPSGLARKIQNSIKTFTGKKLPIRVGTESLDAAEDPGKGATQAFAESPSSGLPGTTASSQPAGVARPGQPASGSKAGPAAFISAPVGRGGKNKPEDVQAVQAALNRRAKAGLDVNGKCDPETIKAIENFQKTLGQFKPDGLVEPRRGTARALAGLVKIGPPPAPPQPIAPPKLGKPTLAKAPAVWHGTRHILETNINELKKGIRGHYGTEHSDLLKEIEQAMQKLGGILDKLDDRLAHSLEKAQGMKDPAARKTELENSKTILADYIKYVKSDPLIVHMDSNPFGVRTSLGKVLTDSLTHIARAIG